MKKRHIFIAVFQLIFLMLNISCNNKNKENTDYELYIDDNDIENDICKIHNLTMEKENVPILYGLIRPDKSEIEYYTLRIKYFPHSNDPTFGGCVISRANPDYSELYVCKECNKERDKYKKKLKIK